MKSYTADELDRLADVLLRAVPQLRAAAKAMRANGAPKLARTLAKKAKRKAKAKKVVRKARAVKKAPRKTVRKAARRGGRSR